MATQIYTTVRHGATTAVDNWPEKVENIAQPHRILSMHEQKSEQKLRDGLRAMRVELEEILHTLSSDGSDAACDALAQPEASDAPPNFFAEITRREQAPDAAVRRQVLRLITSLGYASTLVL